MRTLPNLALPLIIGLLFTSCNRLDAVSFECIPSVPVTHEIEYSGGHWGKGAIRFSKSASQANVMSIHLDLYDSKDPSKTLVSLEGVANCQGPVFQGELGSALSSHGFRVTGGDIKGIISESKEVTFGIWNIGLVQDQKEKDHKLVTLAGHWQEY